MSTITFEQLAISPSLKAAIAKRGFTAMTEIQAQAIPLLLEGDRDFVGQAQTGTGKTAAFLIPLLEKMDPEQKHVQALILSPTRELALQTHAEYLALNPGGEDSVALIYGGASYDNQRRKCKSAKLQVVIGTPGRLRDLIERNVLDLSGTKLTILDEVDEMLRQGFIEDVEYILGTANEERRTWVFSATIAGPVRKLIDHYLKQPLSVKIEKKSMIPAATKQYFLVSRKKYFAVSIGAMLATFEDPYLMFFCRTKEETRNLADELTAQGYLAGVLNGDVPQRQRERIMAAFRAKEVTMLVCTDVAARGIDVTDLTHVINVGMPGDFESYLHRIGRTGRAGKAGVAITLAEPGEQRDLERLQKRLNCEIAQFELPTLEEVVAQHLAQLFEQLSHADKFEKNPAFQQVKGELGNFSRDQLIALIYEQLFHKKIDRYLVLRDISAQNSSRRGEAEPRARRGDSRGREGHFEEERRSDDARGGDSKGGARRGSARKERRREKYLTDDGAPKRERRSSHRDDDRKTAGPRAERGSAERGSAERSNERSTERRAPRDAEERKPRASRGDYADRKPATRGRDRDDKKSSFRRGEKSERAGAFAGRSDRAERPEAKSRSGAGTRTGAKSNARTGAKGGPKRSGGATGRGGRKGR